MIWEQYRKTLVPAQLFIVSASVAVYVGWGRQWFPALFIFAVMQAGVLLGAAWGARMRRRGERADDELPLNRRR